MNRNTFISNIILIAMIFTIALLNFAFAGTEEYQPVETQATPFIMESSAATPSVVYIFTDELPETLLFYEGSNETELLNQIALCDEMIKACDHIIDVDSKLDDIEHPLIEEARSQRAIATENKTLYEYRLNQLKEKEEEYPVATAIWKFLKEKGYSDWVAAGIIGNMMNEAGGNTLNIKPHAISAYRSYYGICQWGKHYPKVWNTELDTQLEFLEATIQQEFNEFGRRYAKGFNYSEFVKLTDEQEAALAFSKCYERNYSSSYSARQKNAVVAYEYFVSR